MANAARRIAGENAPVVAAGAVPPILQFKTDNFTNSLRLPMLKEYAAMGLVGLKNCVNLSLVYLGLISDVKKYLEVCTSRNKGTELAEVDEVLATVVGYKFPSATSKVTPETSFQNILQSIGDSLLPEHATIVWIAFKDQDMGHSVIVKKEADSTLRLLDFQIINPDGSYPFTFEVPPKGSPDAWLGVTPYIIEVIAVLIYMGPTYSSFANTAFTKYEATGKKGSYMNILEGGKQKKKTRRRGKTHKRTHKRKSR